MNVEVIVEALETHIAVLKGKLRTVTEALARTTTERDEYREEVHKWREREAEKSSKPTRKGKAKKS